MKIRPLNGLRGGEVLAEPILTKENEILIPKGTILKKDYVPLMQSLGMDALAIEDPFETYEKPNFFLPRERVENYIERVKKILESHIYSGKHTLDGIEIIAHDLVNEINMMTGQMVVDFDERTTNLYEHTVMVSILSIVVAKKMKLPIDVEYNIAIGCLLHDLGIRYITVPYENCNWDEIQPVAAFEFKKHTILAYTALENEKWIPEIAKKMILSHHERLDGSGFPLRQKNAEIECKIIQACDNFDCLISGMECKRMSIQEALQKMVDEAGKKYDKKVIQLIEATIAKYPVGTTVKTNIQENGVVVSQTTDPDNPIIMLLDEEMKCEEVDKLQNLELEKNISILQVV